MRWKTLAVLLPVVMASTAVWAGDLVRVRSLVEQGRPTEALTDLDEHLEEFPVDPEAKFLRALLLSETQNQEEALEGFRDVSELRPDRPEPLNNLAVIQAAMGDYDTAVETLKEALRTHPAYRIAYENLTKIYGQLASEAYSRALSVDQAHERSSVELVLLSQMVLPEAPVMVAQAPAAPLPSATEDTTAPPASAGVPFPDEPAVEIEEPSELDEPSAVPAVASPRPATPDQAIEEALSRGREMEEEAEPEPEPTAAEAPEPAELAVLVEAWARAWSEQRVEDYLYFYSQSFQPAGDMSKGEWEQFRRERVAAPASVKVSVAFLDFEADTPDSALVRFNQAYESDTFSDVVTKTLELVREDGSWKILRESTDS